MSITKSVLLRRLIWQWRCIRGHEWPARVSDRIGRLLRCQRCVTERGDPATVLATVYPEMISAFHLEANRPLSPYAIKATYHKRLWWHCQKGRGHPPYQASIAKRHKDKIPCQNCRNMKPVSERAIPAGPRSILSAKDLADEALF